MALGVQVPCRVPRAKLECLVGGGRVAANVVEEAGEGSIEGNTQSQALRVKGILQSGSKWSNGSNKSSNGYHVTWGGGYHSR